MTTSLENKSTLDEIRKRFDNDVERFLNIETGQRSMIDAGLLMELITQAAVSCCPNAQTVLDIGCGAGNNTLKLLEKINPLDCDLVDISLPMLKKARERITKVNRGTVRIFQDDIRKAELPHRRYDVILAAAVLHHLRDNSDWEKTFLKLYELTAPGGCIWISDIVTQKNQRIQDMMWINFAKHLESTGGSEYLKKVFDYIDREDSPRSIIYQIDLLRKAGFVDVSILHKNSCFAAFGAIKAK
jgi:tRNA (cmo5U34)-methyltransferase